MVEIPVPLGYDDVGIFINNRLDFLEVSGFYVVPLDKDELCAISFEFGHPSISLHVNVKRTVLLAIKEEGETKEPEHFLHTVYLFILYAKIGIIFNTTKIFPGRHGVRRPDGACENSK